MNRIGDAFRNKKAFIGFLTAGDPSVEKTGEFIVAMSEGGADLVEIGIPFSDPVSEGPTIQEANTRALKNDVSVDKLFEMVENVRKKTNIPLVFLSYYNSIFVYGNEKFFEGCKKYGIDGVIIPDLPYEEEGEIRESADKNDIAIIRLVSPTSEDRIEMLAKDSKGFMYLVSSYGVTGVRGEITTDLMPIVDRIRKVTDTPIAVGFGIAKKEQVEEIHALADGVIVGSAIVSIIEKYGDDAAVHVTEYVKSICGK